MKKILLSIFTLSIILPSIALASWWNPFSWFNGWNFHKTEITIENPTQKNTVPNTVTNDMSDKVVTPTTDTKQKNPSITVKTIPKKDTTKPQVLKIIPPVVITPTPIDICTNIEGVQTTIPSGMILQNGNCTTPTPIIPLPISVDLRISPADSITYNSATLRANLISGAPANVSFTYNEENSDSNKTTPIVYQFNNENFSAQISGLKPNTTYEFYASAYNGSSDKDSALSSFTTPLAPGTCVVGQYWDVSSDECVVKPTCSTGQFWDSYSNKCCNNIRESGCYQSPSA
jgi:hypothetical protein